MDRKYLEEVGLGVLALVLYHTGFLMPLCLVPLQVLMLRRGSQAFLRAALGVAVVLAFSRIPAARSLGWPFWAVLGDAGFFAVMAGGLYFVEAGPAGWDRPRRFLTAVGVMMIPVTILIAWLTRNVPVAQALEGFMAEAAVVLYGESVSGDTALAIARMARESLLGGFLPLYLAIISLNWALGYRFARVGDGTVNRPSLRRFRVPDTWVWGLFVPVTILLLEGILSRGGMMFPPELRFLSWNVTLVMAGMFGLQGLAVLRSLLARTRIGRRQDRGFPVLLILPLLIPGVLPLFVLGMTVLGVMQLWIDLRKDNPKEIAET